MLIEERYRAALVALRDGQWEEASAHLLILAADNPDYRDVGRVLEVLQRTRSVSYWCAAFTIACDKNAYAPARVALDQITALAPSLSRLPTLWQRLAEIAPPAEQSALLQNVQDADEDTAPYAPLSAPADPYPEAAAERDTLDDLQLDPLTELLVDEKWVELSNRPKPASATSDGTEAADPPKKAPGPAIPEMQSPAAAPGEIQAAGESDAVTLDTQNADTLPASSAAPEDPAAPDQPTLPETALVPLPAEPEGEFIRIVPPASETEEPDMAADTPQDHSAGSPADDELRTRHRYSPLQVLGLLAFPLILFIVMAYVLFGQGPPTLLDMLHEAQAGTAINTTLDLISAIDRQLSTVDETGSMESQFAEYASLAVVIAEEQPELETALSAWIEAGREWAAARTALAETCANAESQACEEGRQTVAALAAQAQQQREAVCALTTCPPPAQPGSASS